MEGISDADLVAQSIQGDEAAYGILIDRYFRLVVGTAFRKLQNPEDARDIAQDAFVKAYHSLHNLDDPRRFPAWLKRIAANLAIDLLRKRRHPVVSLDELEETHAVATTDAVAPEMIDHETQQNQTMLMILDSIEELPDTTREAVELRFLESLDYEEIAERLNISQGAVRQRVSRGVRELRDKLEGLQWGSDLA